MFCNAVLNVVYLVSIMRNSVTSVLNFIAPTLAGIF